MAGTHSFAGIWAYFIKSQIIKYINIFKGNWLSKSWYNNRDKHDIYKKFK